MQSFSIRNSNIPVRGAGMAKNLTIPTKSFALKKGLPADLIPAVIINTTRSKEYPKTKNYQVITHPKILKFNS